MNKKTRCTKCGKEQQALTMVLMMGLQGYRRYPVCDSCKVDVEKKQSAKVAHDAAAGASRNG
jgi:hypothetical protein